MPVPEAAVDEDDGLVPCEDEIWLARQGGRMKAEPEALAM